MLVVVSSPEYSPVSLERGINGRVTVPSLIESVVTWLEASLEDLSQPVSVVELSDPALLPSVTEELVSCEVVTLPA